VIKVSDFGLTEDIYARNYFRQGQEGGIVKLPVKWMSPESLHDGIFTEKTDVVCYNNSMRIIILSGASTVEPPITDPPTSGQPLYNGHWLWHQLKLLQS